MNANVTKNLQLRGRKTDMSTYEFNERIKFMLPPGFILSRDEDDEGNEVVSILAGEYEDDEGETKYEFNCRVNYTEYDPAEVDEEISVENLLDLLAERMENSRRMKLPGTPKTIILNAGTPLSVFGSIIKMFSTICLVQVDDWAVMQLITTGIHNDEDPGENSKRYENIYEVLKAARINGEKLPVDSVTPSEIEETVQLTFEDDGEAIDVSPKLQVNFTAGDETTTYEYTAEGMKEVGKERLTRVTPSEELYPHYNSVRSAGGLGFLGAMVAVNASGTEYNFIPFRYAAENDGADEDMKALYNRVIAKDTESYDLHEKAKEMQKLFHVNESVFDPHHDRECELEDGLMHRAYMMSGLRSFAWTLADYCKQHDCTPEDVDNTIASRIANFVANEDWLNYDGTTYCQGLCSGSDLHVYFVPDGVMQADRKKLLPSKEDIDRVRQMKEKFPSYREILSEVHSLNALRKDLKYIYPAVRALWDKLKEDRDYDKALLGNEADIVYAWCALALAAKEPFFSEDGPMTCFFSQLLDEEEQRAKWEAEEAELAEKDAEEWMRKYGKYLEDDPVIDFNGKKFVFSGLTLRSLEKNDPIVQQVIEKGGQYRSAVSGLTDYLVVDPRYAGQTKIVAVTEQLQKGKDIKVVLLEDLEKALEGKVAKKKTSAPAAKKASVEKKPVQADTMSDLSAQMSEMQNQKLSEEDRKTLNEAMGKLGNLMDGLAEGQAAMGKYSDYLEQTEAREKAREEEKTRRKAEALAAGKSEKDIVNMYVILTNEKKLGKLRRSQKEFCEIYEDDFAALSKAEIIKTRKDIMEEMNDEALCGYYAESFKQRSVEDRFAYSTRNLNNVSDEPDPVVKADWAVENSKEWYDPSEYSEVRKLMDADLNSIKKQLDEQFKPVEEGWMKFSTAKDYLEISVCDKASDGSDLSPDVSFFQVVIGGQLVSVNLSTKGFFKMSTTAMNCFPFYWGVTVRDIWEAAIKNGLRDEREGATNGSLLANQALSQIRARYPEAKASSAPVSKNSNSGEPSPSGKPVSAPVTTSNQDTPDTTNSTTEQQPEKKEGCYIATAVYGSYDAPQVMTLRRFRDDTLRNNAFGRLFIRTYYRLSPPIAEKLKNAKLINGYVRSILDKWVDRLNNNQ